MKLRDKNGREITWRDMVIVDEPVNGMDLHGSSFTGEITDIIDSRGLVIVNDEFRDSYTIEAERVVLVSITHE